jgi:hypothetical protein
MFPLERTSNLIPSTQIKEFKTLINEKQDVVKTTIRTFINTVIHVATFRPSGGQLEYSKKFLDQLYRLSVSTGDGGSQLGDEDEYLIYINIYQILYYVCNGNPLYMHYVVFYAKLSVDNTIKNTTKGK